MLNIVSKTIITYYFLEIPFHEELLGSVEDSLRLTIAAYSRNRSILSLLDCSRKGIASYFN